MIYITELESLVQIYCQHCPNPDTEIYDKKQKLCSKCTRKLSFQCMRCNGIYKSFTGCILHLKAGCKPGNPQLSMRHRCTKCNYSANDSYKIKRHALVHVKERGTWRCNWCNAKAGSQKNLELHRMFKCFKKPPLSCAHCLIGFKSRADLIDHMKSEHSQSFKTGMYTDVFVCEKCKKDCLNCLQLQYHRNKCQWKIQKFT